MIKKERCARLSDGLYLRLLDLVNMTRSRQSNWQAQNLQNTLFASLNKLWHILKAMWGFGSKQEQLKSWRGCVNVHSHTACSSLSAVSREELQGSRSRDRPVGRRAAPWYLSPAATHRSFTVSSRGKGPVRSKHDMWNQCFRLSRWWKAIGRDKHFARRLYFLKKEPSVSERQNWFDLKC